MQQSRLLVIVTAAAALGLTGAAPPPPAVYDVQIHYRTEGFGKERVAQYFAMTDYLKKTGFVRGDDPDEREPEDERNLPMSGTIPSAKARLLLGDRRVLAIRLMPAGTKLPEDKAAFLRVHIELPTGLGMDRQVQLREHVRNVLRELGFKEGAIYDHRGNTRLVGSLPVGQIDVVMSDLRNHPAGAALILKYMQNHGYIERRDEEGKVIANPSDSQYKPTFGRVAPVRVVEIMPDMPLPTPQPVTALPPPALEKISPELRQLVVDKEKALEPVRFEAILALTPEPENREWLKLLRSAAPDVTLEGRLGPVVTALAPRGQLVALAGRPQIAVLRLPRAPRPWFPQIGNKAVEPDPLTLKAVRHQLLGRIEQGERAVIVDADFRGWEALQTAFPRARLHLLDLTRERNRDLKMEPYPFSGPGPAQGTRFAEMLLLVAPFTDLTLICVDPASPCQLETVGRGIAGDRLNSLALEQRNEDLNRGRTVLDVRQAMLGAERIRVFEDFRFEGEAEQNRKNYRKKQADHECDEAAYRFALRRYLQLTEALRDLKGVRFVFTGLSWEDGYPVEGSSTLTRFFDDGGLRGTTWFQYTGATRGQAWMGMYHDQDRNEVMEFAPPEAQLLPGRWTKEFNFLAWKSFKGEQTAELPTNALLRVTLQWRESQEPDLLRTGEDPYREPVSNLKLALVYQPDPAGAKQPDDDMEIAAETIGPVPRIAKTLDSGVYEQAIYFRVPKAGRYAVRITGPVRTDTRPPAVPSLPTTRRTFELKPRLFVSTLDGDGRAVLADYSTEAGTLGTPADSRRVERVGP